MRSTKRRDSSAEARLEQAAEVLRLEPVVGDGAVAAMLAPSMWISVLMSAPVARSRSMPPDGSSTAVGVPEAVGLALDLDDVRVTGHRPERMRAPAARRAARGAPTDRGRRRVPAVEVLVLPGVVEDRAVWHPWVPR